MKVKEVILELQKFDPDVECFMLYANHEFSSIGSIGAFDCGTVAISESEEQYLTPPEAQL